MQMRYDTRSVHPLDRYDYYRAASATELAPVSIQGQAPGRLLAAMSAATIGDIELEHVTWSADSRLVTRRTERLIRAHDPECYRIVLGISGVMVGGQAGSQVTVRPGDIVLFDLSRPCSALNGTDSRVLRTVMLSVPRALVPITYTEIRPLTGTLVPRTLPGRNLLAQLLIGLVTPTAPAPDPNLADVLRESVTGLIRRRLGHASGIGPHTRRTLWMHHLHNLIRQHLGDPTFNTRQLARIANISTRFLHALCQDAGHTPVRLIKQLRLEECHRSLRNPAFATRPIKDIAATHGYTRPDQFARDFKQHFGVSATQARTLADGPGQE